MTRILFAALSLALVACGADSGNTAAGTRGGASPKSPGATSPTTPAEGAGATGPTTTNALACVEAPACDGKQGPDTGAKRGFTHVASKAMALTGSPYHRLRDQIYVTGSPQWVIGKFTYGIFDTDLTDEEVDIYVERDCGGSWQHLGTTRTTTGDHGPVDGIPDSGGRVFFQIPSDLQLPTGRHRVRVVVAGDLSYADLVMDVVPQGFPVLVSDVDGTLTTSENAEFTSLLTGDLPGAQPLAADTIVALTQRGIRPIYITARPEYLTGRTHEFLAAHGFPNGVVHTTIGLTGASGDGAAQFKEGELALLKSRGVSIQWGFGNRESDTDAYDSIDLEPHDHRVFLQVTDAHGGLRIQGYSEIVGVAQSSPKVCQ